MSSQEYEAIKLQKSEEVSEILESRHILDDEVKMVIRNAESRGEKLYQPETQRFLAKLKITDVTFYVEYSIAGEKTYIVHTAYSHRAELEE
jgi:glutamate synthase (NADPH/NADH) small chain